MRFAIAALLLLHGLIHLMGFVKPFGLAEIPRLKETTSKAVGVLWLLAALILVAAAVLKGLDRDAWWIPAAIGVVLSQALIISQWGDAKAGTLANVLLALPVVISFASVRFHDENEAQSRALLARASATSTLVTAEDVASLPPPVRRWLERSGAIGKLRAKTVHLVQRGEMRTSPEGKFMPAQATQVFTIEEPGFVWMVDVTMFGLPVVGRDTYVDGRARMLIKAGGLVTVADGTGEKFDQGTLQRFLGEIIWFPSAALAPYLAWEPVDEKSARATMSWKGTTASVLFEFDEKGRVARLSAKRWFNGQTLEDWAIPITEWKTLRGIEVPTRGDATWKADFSYYRWEIVDVEANKGLKSQPLQLSGLQLDQLVH